MKTFLILFAQLNLVLLLSLVAATIIPNITDMTGLEAFWFYFSVGVIAVAVGTIKDWFDIMPRMH